jgi:aldehyde dehydrogenase (NAD+)
MVVTPNADLRLAVEGALFSGFGTAGQRCTSLGTVIVHESVHDEFLAQFGAAASAAAVGDPAAEVLYGPMLDQKFASRFENTWAGSSRTTRCSAQRRRRIGHASPVLASSATRGGLFYHPTIVDGVQADDALFRRRRSGRSWASPPTRSSRRDRAGQRARLWPVRLDLHQ